MNPWFRFYSEFSHDPKVQMMTEAMQRRYIMVMCLRCSNALVTLHETEIAFHLRITDAELAETKALFIAKGFIDDKWNLLNWDKRQFKSDSSAERVARHRENKKKASNADVTLQQRQSNALDTDTDTDTEELHLVADAPLACPVEKIIEAYHEAMPANPRCRVLNDSRKRSIRQRWLEASRLHVGPFGYETQANGIAAWKEFFQICAESDFLTGKTPGRNGSPPFIADVDFLFSPGGFAKCLENKYHREAA